jgi:hypothetical protein
MPKFTIRDEYRSLLDWLPVGPVHDLQSAKLGMNPSLPDIEALERQFDIGKTLERYIETVESALQPVGSSLSEPHFFGLLELNA